MAGFQIDIASAIDPDLPYDNTVAITVNKLKHMQQPLAHDLAGALEILQNTVDHIQKLMRQAGLGELTITDPAAARTSLDVYSTAEVDAIIAALVTDPQGGHDHGGAVPSDGLHAHTIS